jgi:hypothetical protein
MEKVTQGKALLERAGSGSNSETGRKAAFGIQNVGTGGKNRLFLGGMGPCPRVSPG